MIEAEPSSFAVDCATRNCPEVHRRQVLGGYTPVSCCMLDTGADVIELCAEGAFFKVSSADEINCGTAAGPFHCASFDNRQFSLCELMAQGLYCARKAPARWPSNVFKDDVDRAERNCDEGDVVAYEREERRQNEVADDDRCYPVEHAQEFTFAMPMGYLTPEFSCRRWS
jgi:hypothetical protein